MPDVAFTDTITVQCLESDLAPDNMIHGHAEFEVTAPRSAWLAHTTDGFTVTEGMTAPEPLFYRPGPDPSVTLAHQYLLRGALETLAETGWRSYQALIESAVPEPVATLVLPGHHMHTRYVRANGLALARFVEGHRRYAPGHEVAVIAGGYAAHLAETAPQFLPRSGN